MLTLAFIARAGLASKERLKTFFAQIVQQSNGRDVGLALTAGFMLFLREDAWDEAHKFIVGQRAFFTDDVSRAENR